MCETTKTGSKEFVDDGFSVVNAKVAGQQNP